jgi:hypothetical protein
MPKKSSVGNVMRVPDPTIVLMMPAPMPANMIARAAQTDTRSPYKGDRVSSAVDASASRPEAYAARLSRAAAAVPAPSPHRTPTAPAAAAPGRPGA